MFVFTANQVCPQDEDSAVVPLSAYGADKLACELHAKVRPAPLDLSNILP